MEVSAVVIGDLFAQAAYLSINACGRMQASVSQGSGRQQPTTDTGKGQVMKVAL